MAWRSVTESDLLQKLSSDELESLRSAGLAQGQADPVATQISWLVNFVRGYIRANTRNQLGAAGTLPESVILPAIDYLVVEIPSRVAGLLIDLNDTRKTSKDLAVQLFRDIAAGRFAVEDPDDTTETGSGPNGTVVKQPATTLDRDSMQGL